MDAQFVGTQSTACYVPGVDRSTIVRDVRFDAGMTQSCLSALSGVKQPSLSQVKRTRFLAVFDGDLTPVGEVTLNAMIRRAKKQGMRTVVLLRRICGIVG